MNNITKREIEKLTDNLPAIRKVAGWSSEELGRFIGVTKQTISNIETHKNVMTKTQYIAIRTVIDYEIIEKPENELLAKVVTILLDTDDSEENLTIATATREMLEKIPKSAIKNGALIGVSAVLGFVAGAVLTPVIKPATTLSTKWLKKILK